MAGLLRFAVSRCRWSSKVLAVSITLVVIQTMVSWPGIAGGSNEAIVLGRVAYEDRIDQTALDELGEYLVEMADGLSRHETLLVQSNHEMIELLRAGDVDLVPEAPFPALIYEAMAGAEMLVRQWQDGHATYRAHFFTKKSSDIQRINDLAGKSVVFENPTSTAGFLTPKAVIDDRSLLVRPFRESSVRPDVNLIFSNSEMNALGWVAHGRVHAGVISNVDWADDSVTPAGLKRELRIFHTTPDILRAVVLASPKLLQGQKQKLVDILLRMHESDKGQAVLRKFYNTTRFDALKGDALASLNNIRSLGHKLGMISK